MTTYARRDSATARLRKAGVNSRDYAAFITVQDNGQFELNDDLLAKHLADLQAQGALPTEASKDEAKTVDDQMAPKLERAIKARGAAKTLKQAVKTSGDKQSISAVMRRLILEGRTNQEVWDTCQPMFQLDDKKRGYPAWYRTELKNKGQLPRGGQE